RHLGADYMVSSDPEMILKSDKVIFPGVGEARHAMGVLISRGIDEALIRFASTGNPLFGICLGCQILQDFSEERNTDLLGLIPGDVRHFPSDMGLKVPQIGWNTVSHDSSILFDGIPQESSFYFVHSYYLSTKLSDGSDSPWVSGRSDYGITFAAAIHRDNVWATQFHPEKSGPKGLKLLQNFISRVN
ncbi:MAG: imidazole glycerol phosphate synthase subunit HisH, partial [Spirochaetaceae bacterium]|nr:imidazole glycerol phosphate synthase subunit HisH [Spirochaetaceae bacterium]